MNFSSASLSSSILLDAFNARGGGTALYARRLIHSFLFSYTCFTNFFIKDSVLASGDSVLASGGRVLRSGSSVLASGSRVLASGGSVLASGSRVLASGDSVLASGGRVLASGGRVLASGGRVLASGWNVLCLKHSLPPIIQTLFYNKTRFLT